MNPSLDTIFYDGHCGLCHYWVTRVLKAAPDGGPFQFSPLQGEFIQQRLSEKQRADLPDSIAVLTADGRLLIRSEAVLHVMDRLGGRHRRLARLGRLAPRMGRDLVYRFVARIRKRLFRKPENVCPMMPPQLRSRFLT